MSFRICDFPECGRRHRARGWCSGHYNQIREGRTLAPLVIREPSLQSSPSREVVRRSGSARDHFWARVAKSESCWVWTGGRTVEGYGRLKFRGLVQSAHRFSWELLVAPLEPGDQIDHLCHVRECVNPAHLRVATNAQNQQNIRGARSQSQSGIRGVFRDGKGWRAQVRVNGTTHRRRFADAESADQWARWMRSRLHQIPTVSP